MNIGGLRHRIRLVRDSLEADALGQLRPTPATIAVRWGEVVTLSGYEATHARSLRADVTHRVTLRWTGSGPAILPTDKLIHKNRIFNILWCDNLDERSRQLHIYCAEVVK